MAYIYGLIVVSLLFAALHYFTELNNSQKISISLVVLFVIGSAYAFNKYNTIKREQMLNAVIKFRQGKSILCDGVEVNATIYSLSIGTYTFIGKKNSSHYAEMISATTCE